MSWQQLLIHCHSSQSELISELMTEAGSSSITLQDAGDQPIFEPPPGTEPVWPELIISGLFSADENLQPLIDKIQSGLNEQLSSRIEILEDKDWIREWMDSYQPMPFGHNLWICPSWCEPPEPDAVTIMLDPGLAFGTGTHPTTALCLRWLDSFAQQQDLNSIEMIDFGCGSGILAVAALKLGAKQLLATDIDHQALQATLANAQNNQVDKGLICIATEQFNKQYQHYQADVLLANILASPLISLADNISAHVKSNGRLVLSGILEKQISKVIAAYDKHFIFEEPVIESEWVRLSAVKVCD